MSHPYSYLHRASDAELAERADNAARLIRYYHGKTLRPGPAKNLENLRRQAEEIRREQAERASRGASVPEPEDRAALPWSREERVDLDVGGLVDALLDQHAGREVQPRTRTSTHWPFRSSPVTKTAGETRPPSSPR